MNIILIMMECFPFFCFLNSAIFYKIFAVYAYIIENNLQYVLRNTIL
jgi:hypothetical protein